MPDHGVDRSARPDRRPVLEDAGGPRARIQPGPVFVNVKGGRCEVCRGNGQIKIEMHFLPDVYDPCEQCHGERYNRKTLELRLKGNTIANALETPIEEMLEFFTHLPMIRSPAGDAERRRPRLRAARPTRDTLFRGEAQRVELAAEPGKVTTGKTLYILELTTGPPLRDIERLLELLTPLAAAGNTVVVIGHNLDVIKVPTGSSTLVRGR